MTNLISKAILLFFVPLLALAKQPSGIGGMAANLMSPVSVLSDFVSSGCLLLGVSFLFASIVKYIEHKRSPLMVPISTVVFFIIAGIVLIAIPVCSYLYEYGVPYSLFK